MTGVHLSTELARNIASGKVVAQTRFGPLIGARTDNGAAVWLEIPYALPPKRFQNPQPLPDDYRYNDKAFIDETAFCAQPYDDRQSEGEGMGLTEKLGYGKPTEDCLFLNIICPPRFPSLSGIPVKVFIHGGFLQYGSPHLPSGRSQSIAARNNEIWVNLSYRLSIFGFFACDEPRIEGNFGFKDLWMALEWIKGNISAFGGNPDDIQVTGLSAGAHAIHQLMHHASHLPEGVKPPFNSVFLQSNAILATPKKPSELRPQFRALCEALQLDPSSPDILETLSNPAKVPASVLTTLFDSEKLGKYGSFRSCLDGTFLPSIDSMEWQRSGELGRKLKEKGIKSVCIGEVSEEWYMYAIAHEIKGFGDLKYNVERYYPTGLVEGLLDYYGDKLEGDTEYEQAFKQIGRVLSAGQTYLPGRILHRDLANAGLPVLRYHIRWSPEKLRPKGYVTHGTDRMIWAFLTNHPEISSSEAKAIDDWLNVFFKELRDLEEGKPARKITEVLMLKEDKSIAWVEDPLWDETMLKLRLLVPGEK